MLVVTVVGVLVTGVGVLVQARGTDGSGPATSSTTRVPAGDFVALSRSSGLRFATPRNASELGVPPEFGNGTAANYHCDAWEEWLPTVDAVPAYQVAVVEVRAPADTAVVITGVSVEVLEFTELTPDATEVRCFYEEFATPPDQFHVDPGHTEVIVFSPTGDPGFYEWTLTVRAVVDQPEVEQTLGSPDDPLRAWVPDPAVQVGPHSVDWDRSACEWSESVQYVSFAPDDTPWPC